MVHKICANKNAWTRKEVPAWLQNSNGILMYTIRLSHVSCFPLLSTKGCF